MNETVERMLPLYEAKMIHQFDHRWATYEPDGTVRDVTLAEKQDPSFVALPRYWVREEVVADRLAEKNDLLVGVRDITNSTNERTVIASFFPWSAVGNNLPLILDVPVESRLRLIAYLSSFALDFIARPKVGGVHLNFFIANQLAVPEPEQLQGSTAWCENLGAWIDSRVVRLISDNTEIASALNVPLTTYDAGQQESIRAELDAAVFQLLSIGRDDVEYILETFPIVKRKDVVRHGSYVTKERILSVYDSMQRAIDSGQLYISPLEGLLVEAAEVNARHRGGASND